MLRKCHTPDQIGVPFQNCHFLIHVRVPQPDSLVHPRAGERDAIGRKRQHIRGANVAGERSHQAVMPEIPQKDSA